ncbi:TIR domain-containing protein [bacterium]|nr:TIR domain-containing protein [bacterium]
MARRVFFSFHYQNDLWRVNQVRNSHIVEGTAAAGFQDASLWEEAKLKGDAAIKKLIDDGLYGTTVTAVLIGAETANRKYVQYEIEKSIARGNGLLGIYIHNLKDQYSRTSFQGQIPGGLVKYGASIYHWDRNYFGRWVELAALEASQRRPSPAAQYFNSLFKSNRTY